LLLVEDEPVQFAVDLGNEFPTAINLELLNPLLPSPKDLIFDPPSTLDSLGLQADTEAISEANFATFEQPKKTVHWGPNVNVRNVEILDVPYFGWVLNCKDKYGRLFVRDTIGVGLSNDFQDSVIGLDAHVAEHEQRAKLNIDFVWSNSLFNHLKQREPIRVIWSSK
jgi:hypothetical protein